MQYTLQQYTPFMHLGAMLKLIEAHAREQGITEPVYAHRLQEASRGFLQLMYYGDEPVGYCAGARHTVDWEEHDVAELMFMFLLPKHRSFWRVKQFFLAFKQWTVEQGLETIDFTVSLLHRERVVALMVKYFEFVPVATQMRLELSNGRRRKRLQTSSRQHAPVGADASG